MAVGRWIWSFDDGFCYIEGTKIWKLDQWRGRATGDPVLYIDETRWSVALPDSSLIGAFDPGSNAVYYQGQEITKVYDGGAFWIAALSGREIRSSKENGGAPGDAAYGAIFWNLFGDYLS